METCKTGSNGTVSDPVKQHVPFPIGYIYGTERDRVRNGLESQVWLDGSRYEGEFQNDLKHGVGVYTWPNGEVWRFCLTIIWFYNT